VKSPSTICNEIYVEMRKMAKQFDSDILLRVNPEVAKALKASNGKWLMEMEELTKHNIIIKSDPTLHQEQFDM
jgi:ribonuclease E